MDEETQELTRRQTRRYVFEVKLDDGQTFYEDVGEDEEDARARLVSVRTGFETESFIQLGESALVRTEAIRYIRLRGDVDEGDGGRGGFIDAVKSRLGGDSDVSDYEREDYGGGGAQRITASVPRRGGQSGEGGQRMGWADEYIGYGRRPWSETKPFWATSEFLTLLGVIAGLAIAMGVLDNFNANRGWLLITVIGAAYMIARGLAKSGTRDPNPSRDRT